MVTSHSLAWRLAMGQLLMLERRRLNLTQVDVSLRIGVTQRSVSEIERGLSPTVDHVINYCEAIGLGFPLLVAQAAMLVESRHKEDQNSAATDD
jgi:transcriptional regulator with XRE-family HTH domain